MNSNQDKSLPEYLASCGVPATLLPLIAVAPDHQEEVSPEVAMRLEVFDVEPATPIDDLLLALGCFFGTPAARDPEFGFTFGRQVQAVFHRASPPELSNILTLMFEDDVREGPVAAFFIGYSSDYGT